MNRHLSRLLVVLALTAVAVIGCTDSMQTPPPPPDPVPNFSWSGVTIAPAQIAFTNLSTHADQYNWDFGDSTSSSDSNATHIYARPGLYSVVLTARSSETGVSVFKDILLPIDSGPVVANFELPSNPVTNSRLAFRNTSQNGDRFAWRFGDGQISEAVSPSITFTDYRTYSVTLDAYSRDGRRSNSITKHLVVTPSRVYLDSVYVVAYPELDPSNRSWDPQDGPDLFWTMNLPDGQTISSTFFTNATPDSLPIGWRTPNAGRILTNWQHGYLLTFYDSDLLESALVEMVGFTVDQIIQGSNAPSEYPAFKVLTNGGLSVRIVLRWS